MASDDKTHSSSSAQNIKVTSGRSGGVKPEHKADNDKEAKLKQGETLGEHKGKGESGNAAEMKKAININGGQSVDPAYREQGDGGKAANKGNLGLEKPEKESGDPNRPKGSGSGRESKL